MTDHHNAWIQHWIAAEQDTRPIRVRRPKPRPKRESVKPMAKADDRRFLDRLESSLQAVS